MFLPEKRIDLQVIVQVIYKLFNIFMYYLAISSDCNFMKYFVNFVRKSRNLEVNFSVSIFSVFQFSRDRLGSSNL